MARMRRMLPAAGLLIVSLALKSSASEAIYSYGFTSINIVGYVNGGAGFAFSPLTDISVTSLGYNGSELAFEPCLISLLNASGGELASATITTGDPLFNQTRYQSISDLTLH